MPFTTNNTCGNFNILHLSDIHLGTESQARQYRTRLETDLMRELKVKHLEYLVISGDIACQSTEAEYAAAFELINALMERFGLDAKRVVIVPGNHDLNWELSEQAYSIIVPQRKLPKALDGRYIPAGKAGALKCDEAKYPQRFAHFNEYFYQKIHQTSYPLDPAEQGILHFYPQHRLLFLAMNSCWKIDHCYTDRAGICMDALTGALDQLRDAKYDDWLKIAVWHHPITGPQTMENPEFMEQLATHGFRICLHGHIHEAAKNLYQYDSERKIHIIGAGTFGAPVGEQVAGIPLQYNLLAVEADTLIVHSRKKEKTYRVKRWLCQRRFSKHWLCGPPT
ncbi:MAG: metallophosphoesterase [Gammaproteobacteria bacterium]|nr:metallophosphoesterase [Gammaproteobacteria bacterium]